MCHKVYFLCKYCNAHRFFMWEECNSFWAQYQRIVIDMDSFHERPRLGIVARDSKTGVQATVLVCGAPPDKAKCRPFRLGMCPRLHAKCPSLQEYTKEQERQEEKKRLLTKLRGERDGRNSDKFKREFAEKWFRKRPVPTYWCTPPSPSAVWTTRRRRGDVVGGGLDGAADLDVATTFEDVFSNEDEGEVVEKKLEDSNENDTAAGAGAVRVCFEERRDSVMQDSNGCLLGSTIAACGPSPARKKDEFVNADMAQSLASTMIESGSVLSEAVSCEWNELYKSVQSLKIVGEGDPI